MIAWFSTRKLHPFRKTRMLRVCKEMQLALVIDAILVLWLVKRWKKTEQKMKPMKPKIEIGSNKRGKTGI